MAPREKVKKRVVEKRQAARVRTRWEEVAGVVSADLAEDFVEGFWAEVLKTRR